jgi:hypothetical protein
MADPAEIVERLRALAEKQRALRGDMMFLGEADPEILEAAATIESQQRLIERMRAVVREEYDYAKKLEERDPDDRYLEGIGDGICDVMNRINALTH